MCVCVLCEEYTAGMASLPHGNMNCSILCKREAVSFVGLPALPFLRPRARAFEGLVRGQSVISLLYLNFCIIKKLGLLTRILCFWRWTISCVIVFVEVNDLFSFVRKCFWNICDWRIIYCVLASLCLFLWLIRVAFTWKMET